MNKKYALFALLGTMVVFLISATVSRIKVWNDGEILTASQLNAEFSNIVSGVNNITNDNISASAAISPSKIDSSIAGSGLDVNPSGVLSVPLREFDETPSAQDTVSYGVTGQTTVDETTAQYTVASTTLTTEGGALLVIFGPEQGDWEGMVCAGPSGGVITISIESALSGGIVGKYAFGLGSSGIVGIPPLTLFVAGDGTGGSETITVKAQHTSTSIECIVRDAPAKISSAIFAVEL